VRVLFARLFLAFKMRFVFDGFTSILLRSFASRDPLTEFKSSCRILVVLPYFKEISNFRGEAMSKVCQVTGKKPMSGNNVSHAKNRTRRRFEPNLQSHRFWIEEEKRFVRLRLSAKGMRIVDKLGIQQVLADMRKRGEKV